MILVTAKSFIDNKVANFVLNKDDAMDLCYGHSTFQNNFELVYSMELLGITQYTTIKKNATERRGRTRYGKCLSDMHIIIIMTNWAERAIRQEKWRRENGN